MGAQQTRRLGKMHLARICTSSFRQDFFNLANCRSLTARGWSTCMQTPSPFCRALTNSSTFLMGPEWQQQRQLSHSQLPAVFGRPPCRHGRRSTKAQQTVVCRYMKPVHSNILVSTYVSSTGDLMRAATFSRLTGSMPDPADQRLELSSDSTSTASTSGRVEQAEVLEFPSRAESQSKQTKEPPLVRVRLSVHYRVHSRQMLCIGGSQFPFGWSFLSIAKVPMVWNDGDIWTAEVQCCLIVALLNCTLC